MNKVFLGNEGFCSTGLIFILLAMTLCSGMVAADDPMAIPTFHCLGVYWNPDNGSADKVCQVKYRIEGSDGWSEALPLWFDEHDRQYRGSIVNLKHGTTYEIQLSLDGTDNTQTFTAATWRAEFPIARTVHLPDGVSSDPLDIAEDQSGTPEGYVLYTASPGGKAEIDVQNLHDHCITVRASYVIIRG